MLASWLHVKHIEVAMKRCSSSSSKPPAPISKPDQADDQLGSEQLQQNQLQKLFEQFQDKVSHRLQSFEVNNYAIEIINYQFFKSATEAWTQTSPDRYQQEVEPGCSLKLIESEIARGLVPLVQLSKQAQEQNELKLTKDQTSELRSNQDTKSIQQNNLQSRVRYNSSNHPMPWANSQVIECLLTAIDKSTKFKRPSWQCMDGFSVSVVEVDESQIKRLAASSQSFSIPAGEKIPRFRLIQPDSNFYTTLMDAFLTMNASNLVILL